MMSTGARVNRTTSVGILFTQAADGRSKHYEKHITPENGRRPQLKPVGAGFAADVPCSWSFSATGLNVYRQRAVSLSTCPAGVFGRRVSPFANTTMHATPRTTTAPTFNQGCPGCPGGVPAGPPQKWDTRKREYKHSPPEIHSNISEVSRVSRVITKTIAYAGASAHMRPVNGFSNQAGQPGHPSISSVIREVEARKRRIRVSHFESFQPGHPGTPGTPAVVGVGE